MQRVSPAQRVTLVGDLDGQRAVEHEQQLFPGAWGGIGTEFGARR